MSMPDLKPDEVLRAEYDYIVQCAFQANEDRARVASFYFVSLGTLVAAILGAQFDLSEWAYRAFGLLFVVLTVLGVLTIFQLARLRAAWNSAAVAMNAIKSFYVDKYPELEKPIVWRIPPKKENWYSIANLLRLQVGLLGSMTFGAAIYTFINSFYIGQALPWWGWVLMVALPIVLFYFEHRWYHDLLGM